MCERSPNNAKLVKNIKCLHLRTDSGLLGILDFGRNGAESEDNMNRANGKETVDNKVRLDYLEEVEPQQDAEVTAVEPFGLMSKVTQDLKKFRIVSNKSKVHVGNVSFRVKNRELKEFFGYFGKVLFAQIIKDRVKKRSRGFGFVTFSSPQEAERAMNSDDYERTLENRVMTVVPATRKRRGAHEDNDDNNISLEDAVQMVMNEPEEEDNNTERVTNLNDDIMLHIFSFLGLRDRVNLERVCCRWRLLAIKSWNSVQRLEFSGIFSLFKGGLTDDILLGLLRRGCANLRILDLSASPFLLTEFAVHCIAKHCKNLREVDLTGVEVSTSSLKTLSQKCTLLEKIMLRKCYKAGEKGFWWVFKQCTNLKSVDIAESTRITGQCFFMLPSTIETLNLQECTKLSDIGLKYIAARCLNLHTIDISQCAAVTDTGFLDLTQNCIRIENFKFVQPPKGVTIRGLSGISNLQQLKELNISRCAAVGDELLFVLGCACFHLTTLNIEACGENVTDAGLQSLVACYQLKNLNISYLVKITHVGLSQLVVNGSLEIILARACQGLTNEAVESVLRGCPVLTRLDISGCLNITEGSLQHFISYCSSTDRPLALSVVLGGTLISEESVTEIKSRCPRCEFDTQDLSVEMLRTDRDPYFGMGDFYPEFSDDEEDDDEDEEDEFVPQEDQYYEDFLEADDPAMLQDYENWS